MDDNTWVWIIVAVIALLVLGALVAALLKKKQERDREQAAEIRDNAQRWGTKLDQREAEARGVEAEAQRARAEADQLEAVAEQRRMRVESERAKHAETLREADELDPDTDTSKGGSTRTDTGKDSGKSSGTHRHRAN